jgi:hypothetical protein
MHRALLLGVGLLLGAVPVWGQEVRGAVPGDSLGPLRPGRSLDLGVRRVGLSLGNAPRWVGVRLNWADAGVERVDGVNLTIWKPKHNPDALINGVAFGVVAPVGRSIRGSALGGVAIVTEQSLHGVGIAGVAQVSGGHMVGVHLSGVALVSGGTMAGLNVAGAGLVASGSLRGVNLAGLGAVAEQDMLGVNFATLGLVSQGAMRWVNLAGLGVVGQRGVAGLTVAGLGIVSGGGRIEGIALTPGVVESSDGARGILVGGYRVKGPRIEGLSLNPVMLKARDFTGVALGAHNEVMGTQRGLTIGIYNFARRLQGVQLGVLNYAGNNPPALRLLPLVNMHFD